MPYVPPPVWSFTPFVLILLSIAVIPLVPGLEHWWHSNRNKLLVSFVLVLATLLFYAFLHNVALPGGKLIAGGEAVLHVLDQAVVEDFIPFIVLLFSLYTISGGILLTGDIEARPRTNCAFLAAGSVLASFIGTTGASMLLIRPLLRTNAERKHKFHTVIFFIFLVSNIGGSLTPLGDPPLFLGFLRGVPFWWTATHLLVPWAVTTGVLLAIYYLWDTFAYGSEEERDIVEDITRIRPLRLQGSINLLWLLAVIAAVALVDSSKPLPLIGWQPFSGARECVLLFLAFLSWFTTPGNREIRRRNDFSFYAMIEVACLFIGIFICMQPPLEYLHHEGAHLGLKTPAHFFWATGAFSSFLDNAPTYVVFFETAKALTESLAAGNPGGVLETVTVAGGVISRQLLFAVSLGAVFMGANTYIGNAPNFMVKSIAEHAGVKMPSFFGYMALAVVILIPVFVMLTFLFML